MPCLEGLALVSCSCGVYRVNFLFWVGLGQVVLRWIYAFSYVESFSFRVAINDRLCAVSLSQHAAGGEYFVVSRLLCDQRDFTYRANVFCDGENDELVTVGSR